jgi:hypothetical protein
MTPDPLTAIVDQLAAHGEQLTRLDAREAAHHTTLPHCSPAWPTASPRTRPGKSPAATSPARPRPGGP